ncbi:MAG: HAD domain-containing protein [Delftia lacustris]|uniref:HAD domain-containing protein n=1 Tax=Delftia TaxID=80865 RepID=UPI00211ABDDB|nr:MULTISPECIES: HAD domain-containing protein [Delftia]WON86738.1 HAD domain-containing protein [Delftia sp. UGAL515B_04]
MPPKVTDHEHIAWRENADMTSMSAGSSTPYIPASSPRTADVVLYLDLDGVVHHEAVLWHPRRGIYMSPYQASEHSLFEWLPLLQEELTPYPQVAIVLSSTWCIRPGYAKTLQLLPNELRARFIGGTFHKRVHGADPWLLASFRDTSRGQQILEDVTRRKPRQWVALDADIEDWPAQPSEFAKLLGVDRSCLSRYEREQLGAPTSVINHCLGAIAAQSRSPVAGVDPVRRALRLTIDATRELQIATALDARGQ